MVATAFLTNTSTQTHNTTINQYQTADTTEQDGTSKSESKLTYNTLSKYYGFREIEIIKSHSGIMELQILDFNLDGRNDMAFVNNHKAKIELLIQKEKLGPAETPTFLDPNDVDINQIIAPTRFEQQSIPVSHKIFALVCGDLNGDELPDIAYYGQPKGLYIIFQKTTNTKTLNWQSPKKIAIQDGLANHDALICADLNNDGRDDLALASTDKVYFIKQKKDTTLEEPVKYPIGQKIRGITAGDLNGDNINDFIVVTNDAEKPLCARFGKKTGQLGPQLKFFIEKPYQLKLHDIDDSTEHEILTIDQLSGRLMCYKFSNQTSQKSDWPIAFFPLPFDKKNADRDLEKGDFDGDGLTDLIASAPEAAELILYKQIQDLGLAEPLRFPAFTDITDLSVADIDNDGKTEIAVLSVKEKVLGLTKYLDARLSFPKPIDLDGEPLAMQLADVDGNHSTDCLYICKDVNNNRFMRVIYDLNENITENETSKKPNNTENKKQEPKPNLKLEKLSANPQGLKVMDVDQDGLMDVLVFVKYETPTLIHQGKKGEFKVIDSPKSNSSLISKASLSSINTANVDGKKGKELLLAEKNFARSLIFQDGIKWRILDQYNAKSSENTVSTVAAFNIPGYSSNEKPVILLLDAIKGQLQILKPQDNQAYRFEKQLKVGRFSPATHLKMLFASVTGPHPASILIFDSENFALITPPTNQNPTLHLQKQFSYETKIKKGTYGNLACGDINHDQKADIIMVEYKRNYMEILALDHQYQPLPAMRFKIFEEKSYRRKSRNNTGKFSVEPREMKVEDVTADGKKDLITIIHDRIIIYPQD